MLKCDGLADKSELTDAAINYEMVFENSVEKMIKVAKEIRKRLKVRQKLLDEPGWEQGTENWENWTPCARIKLEL